MSQRNPFKLFVSHLWQDQDDYFRVFEYLESTTNFYYLNYSKPAQKPAGTKEDLKAELRRQIEPAETVIILSSMYEDFREWIEFQVNAAQAMNKPLIVMKGLEPETFPTGFVIVPTKLANGITAASRMRYAAQRGTRTPTAGR